MNKKAESFKKYLDEKKIEVFQIEEIKDDANTVIFRSQLNLNNQFLPVIYVTDDSIFSFIRVLVAPTANSNNEKSKILKLLNDLSAKYKPFKFYVNEQDEIILDCSLLNSSDEVDGNLVYGMLESIISYLQEEDYKKIMKEVWL